MPKRKKPVSIPKSQKPNKQQESLAPPVDRIEELQRIINRSQLILDHLQNNVGWEMVLEDITKEKQRLDDNWQYETDEKKWIEWRATKMAVIKILNVLNDYRMDIQTALEEKYKLENPDKVIHRDVDNY
jgi:hypothetical protein